MAFIVRDYESGMEPETKGVRIYIEDNILKKILDTSRIDDVGINDFTVNKKIGINISNSNNFLNIFIKNLESLLKYYKEIVEEIQLDDVTRSNINIIIHSLTKINEFINHKYVYSIIIFKIDRLNINGS